MACTRFRRHRVRWFDGAGGGSWRDGSLPSDDPQHAFPGHGQMKPEQLEIARLKREVAKLKAERDILEKAAVGSSGERNALGKLSAWSHEAKSFPWPRVELGRDSIEERGRRPRRVRWRTGGHRAPAGCSPRSRLS